MHYCIAFLRGTIDYSPTRLTSTNISFLPRCLSKVICAVGETPPYPHVCFIGSDRIIPLVHIINHSLLSPCRKHLFFCFKCHFYSWVSFSCSKKWRKIWRTQNMKRYFEKNITCTSFRLHDRALEQYIYTADVVKGQIASYWCFEWLLIKCPEN